VKITIRANEYVKIPTGEASSGEFDNWLESLTTGCTLRKNMSKGTLLTHQLEFKFV
jgi:hypothetical protein